MYGKKILTMVKTPSETVLRRFRAGINLLHKINRLHLGKEVEAIVTFSFKGLPYLLFIVQKSSLSDKKSGHLGE